MVLIWGTHKYGVTFLSAFPIINISLLLADKLKTPSIWHHLEELWVPWLVAGSVESLPLHYTAMVTSVSFWGDQSSKTQQQQSRCCGVTVNRLPTGHLRRPCPISQRFGGMTPSQSIPPTSMRSMWVCFMLQLPMIWHQCCTIYDCLTSPATRWALSDQEQGVGL